jgi:hypothetical protein
MKIDNAFIESLLYEEEGVELDCKRDQYKFVKATDDDKCELLKDILAFANAWRRSDAFILIGIEEVKGGRSTAVGISDMLDDADVQQFVNSKTNRPVIFSYQNLVFEGKRIAIIHIPIQQRPIYLNKDFGKLKGNTVYVRRGSSTDIASPTEISRMGYQDQVEHGKPELHVFFADPKTRTRLQDEQNVVSLVLETPEPSSIPDYGMERQSFVTISLSRVNYSYYKELVDFTKTSRLVSPFYFAVGNTGSTTAKDVRLEMKIDKVGKDVLVMDSYRFPRVPEREHSFDPSYLGLRSKAKTDYVKVRDIGDFWLMEARADKVQPQASHWFNDPFYIGSHQSHSIDVLISIFADELSTPKQQQLRVNVQSEHRKVSLEDIIRLEEERFAASPEYKRLMSMHEQRKAK